MHCIRDSYRRKSRQGWVFRTRSRTVYIVSLLVAIRALAVYDGLVPPVFFRRLRKAMLLWLTGPVLRKAAVWRLTV